MPTLWDIFYVFLANKILKSSIQHKISLFFLFFCFSWNNTKLKVFTLELIAVKLKPQNFCLTGKVSPLAKFSRYIISSITILAPVPLSIFRSNSKFDENSERYSFEYTRPITTIFCTRHDSDTVVTCAKYRCDRPCIFYTRVFWIFIEFRIRSKYA